MTTTIYGGYTDPQLDGAHQLPDEGEPTGLARVERLGHEEQWTPRTQRANRVERALEEQPRILKGDVLIEKWSARAEQDDQADAVRGEQGLESLAEQGRELMTGEGARDVDLPQEPLGAHAAGLRIRCDGGGIEGQRRIDDGHGDATADGRCRGADGDTRDAGLATEDGRAGLGRRGRDGTEREERRQHSTLSRRNRRCAVCHDGERPSLYQAHTV